jgi:branched-chain amino acid transport system substrate-binding protein
MDKKVLLGIGVIVVIVLTLIVFLGFSGPTGQFALGSNKPLVVGASLAMSGKAASYGEAIRNGMTLALEDINSSGSLLSLRVLFDDTASSPEKAVTSAKKFIEIDGAKAIISVGADDVLATVPVTEASKSLLLTPVAGSDKVDGAGKYVFRNREPSKLVAYALADLVNKRGINRVALFIASSSSPISYADSFVERFSSLGKSVDYNFKYDETSVDVRTAISIAKANNINAVFVVASKDKDGAQVVKQLKELGYTGLIVGGPALETPAFFDSVGDSAQGIIIATAMVDESAPDANRILVEYKKRFGIEMPFYAANAYDLVMLLNLAAGKCKDDTDCIRDYLHSVKEYPGIGGKTTFNSDGGVTKPMAYKIAQGGKFVLYKAS